MGATASKDEADVVHFTPQVEKNERKAMGTPALQESDGANNNSTMNGATSGIKAVGDSDENTGSTTASTHDGMEDDRHPDVPSSVCPQPVADDMVHVNLAMADLMAYLQVVANNSANLPLTKRDDPELGRTVSTLTADEYAMKSEAFVPSDVRIVGGSFLKYGRVWDLPTSEKLNPVDGAKEPGRSHGGACCNALLKVLYDAESEANDVAQSELMNPANLFNDDESTLAGNTVATSRSFETLTDLTLNTSITWAGILRKMKTEMRGAGFAQVPTITSSRKFDLNQPFYLSPPEFDTKKNKKRSLLIGCNYGDGQRGSIKACHDDIRSMKDYIVNVHGFPEAKGLMTVLLDDRAHKPPTHKNITEAFKALSEQSQPGDAVFVQFSGHGGRVLDSAINGGTDSYDEAIIPSDFKKSGIIRDTLIFKTLLAPMRSGVTVTVLIDCCDKGMMLDLPYSWTTRNDRAGSVAKMSLNDGFSFVRFLKVVKTLYETSKFTQLGNTVDTALKVKDPSTARGKIDGDDQSMADDSVAAGSLMTMDDNDDDDEEDDETKNKKQSRGKKSHEGLYSIISSCIFPNTTLLKNKHDGTDQDMYQERSGAVNKKKVQSLIQQMMNCTLNARAEDSDEDTFQQAHTYDEDYATYTAASVEHSFSLGVASTFGTYDSVTDVSLEKPRTRSRRRR